MILALIVNFPFLYRDFHFNFFLSFFGSIDRLSSGESEEKERMTTTPSESNSTVLGIAFGNSTTQISFISRAGVPECLANEDGERQIPSILSYSEGEEYHAGQAKSQLVRNGQNTLVSFRDWLGRKYLNIHFARLI